MYMSPKEKAEGHACIICGYKAPDVCARLKTVQCATRLAGSQYGGDSSPSTGATVTPFPSVCLHPAQGPSNQM